MTILSQAQTIRDETAASANTATRVGTCLVDIANTLSAPAANVASGNIQMDGTATVIPDDAFRPIAAAQTQTITTSSGIVISTHSTPDYTYFSGLTVGKFYRFDYSFSITMNNAGTTVSPVICNLAGDQLENPRTLYIENANQVYTFAATTIFEAQSTGTVVLYMKLDDPAGATVTVTNISMTIQYLGDAV